MKWKRTALAAVAAIIAVFLGACTTTGEKGTPREPASSESEKAVFYNPLTGQAGYDQSARLNRPVAVMVNNIEQSLPQQPLKR